MQTQNGQSNPGSARRNVIAASMQSLSSKTSRINLAQLDDGHRQLKDEYFALPDITNTSRVKQVPKKSSLSLQSQQLAPKRPGSSQQNLNAQRIDATVDFSLAQGIPLKAFQLTGQHKADQIPQDASQNFDSKRQDRIPKVSNIEVERDDLGIDLNLTGLQDQRSKRRTINQNLQPLNSDQSAQGKIDFHSVSRLSGRSSTSKAKNAPSRNQSAARQPDANSLKPPNQQAPLGTQYTKKVNAWESFEVNQFTVRNQSPAQFIEKLKQLTASDIPFMADALAADEMDSTDPLDSLIQAFVKVTSERTMTFSSDVKKRIHLATGTRTEFCEQMLAFICSHQKLEQAFRDSVDFFMESLTTVVRLEDENKNMKQNVTHLLGLKEDGIVAKFNLEKRLKEQLNNVDKLAENEKQLHSQINDLKHQLADKFAECESLEYRLNHLQEGLLGPQAFPLERVPTRSTVLNVGGAVPFPPPGQDQSSHRNSTSLRENVSLSQENDTQKLRDLLAVNRKLEEELQQLRDDFSQKDNSEHFKKIQDLFNKIQIENKNLRIYNQKCESKLETKQNLIGHLENKVTSVMIEKEEIILKLKSEVVLLQNKLEVEEQRLQSKLSAQQSQLEETYSNRYRDAIRELEGTIQDLQNQRADLKLRVSRVHGEHDELKAEFVKYRREKDDQEDHQGKLFKSLEEKIQNLQKTYDEKIDHLNGHIEEIENQNEVMKRDTNIVLLRQKYLKSQTETLAKQKVFLFETLEQAKVEIEDTLSKMEKGMMSDNNNQAYLVSVEKCIKQAKKMADMGTAALGNISQILQFLKIEKLHALLSQEEELEELETQMLQQINEEKDSQSKVQQSQQHNPANAPQKDAKAGAGAKPLSASTEQLMIQRLISKFAVGTEAVAPVKPSESANPKNQTTRPHTKILEASVLSHLSDNPIELASACLKMLANILVQLNNFTSLEELPDDMAHLLKELNNRSNQVVENAIQSQHFNNVTQMIDRGIQKLSSKQTHGHEQGASPQGGRTAKFKQQTANLSFTNAGRNSTLGARQQSVPKPQLSSSEQTPHDALDLTFGYLHNDVELLKLELKKVFNQLQEQKVQSKNLQLNLAGRIVTLEEQIEQMNREHTNQISQIEETHEEVIAKVTQGVEQRERQLGSLCEEYMEEIGDLQFKLESSWKPAEEVKTIQKMEEGARGNLYNLMKYEYEQRFKKNSELLNNYMASINEFVYLREDQRGSFTLAFECDKLKSGILQFLNETMLKFYLSKTFQLDKTKFRYLTSEKLLESLDSDHSATQSKQGTEILKIIVEIVAEDNNKISQIFKNVKSQIKDGTSLLYDFSPLYFGMNLGSSGFSTHHNLKDFALLSKTGQIIDGQEYIVSILRNRNKPLVFKVIASNLDLREEYLMELSEHDIYELTEGDQHILKSAEPDLLIKKMITNLNLITRDKIKVLICEQKIFFNELWMSNMESTKNRQVHVPTPMEAVLHRQETNAPKPVQSALSHTAARTSQLSRLQTKKLQLDQTYLQKFTTSVECQTDLRIPTHCVRCQTELKIIQEPYEGYKDVFKDDRLHLGESVSMRLIIQQSIQTNTLYFVFDDMISQQNLKFSFYQNSSEDQYTIHSEYMKIDQNHLVLITVEKIQEQAILVRMHDLLSIKSLQFSLVRKQEGSYHKLQDDVTLDLLINGEFRGFIYELTYVPDLQQNAISMQNMQALFTTEAERAPKRAPKSAREIQPPQPAQKQAEQQDQVEALRAQQQQAAKVLPQRRRAQDVQRVVSFSRRAFFRDREGRPQQNQRAATDGSQRGASNQLKSFVAGHFNDNDLCDWRDRPAEKGILLYRNVFPVRPTKDGAELAPQNSFITFYLNAENVNIEVSFYQEKSKRSIASSVHHMDLFGEDPLKISFGERLALLNGMMEKLFVIEEDSIYHMKVESDAVPIQVYLEERKKAQQLKNPKENQAQELDVILTSQSIRNIQDQKEELLTSGKAVKYIRYTDIDGETHGVEMLFIKKERHQTEKSGQKQKKPSTYGKSRAEIAQMQIEAYLDEHCDWDQIYFEIIDSNNETVSALYSRRKLSFMLSKDEFLEWRSVISNADPLLLDHIKNSIQVDKANSEVSLQNRENIEIKILRKFRKSIGGSYLMRQDLELSEDEIKIIQRQLIFNTEIEMSEFLYDIKLFQVSRTSNKDIISYQLEIFSLYDPDVVYLYNYPMSFSADTQDPHSLVIDIFNIIEHPFKKGMQPSKKSKFLKNSQGLGPLSASQQNSSSKNMYPKDSASQGTAQELDGQSSQVQRQGDKNTAFQSLFRKYIDNRMILMIQEQRFPRKLDFIMVEPSSQLVWRQQIEPRHITTGMASMHLVDQATLEMFVSVVLDENEHYEANQVSLYEYRSPDSADNEIIKVQLKESWNNIQETEENATFVKGLVLENDISVTIRKRLNGFSVILLSKPGSNLGGGQLQQASGKDSADPSLEINFSPTKGDTQFAKVIMQKEMSYCVLYVKVQGLLTTVKLVRVDPTEIQVIFKFQFEDEIPGADVESDEDIRLKKPQGPIFTAKDLQMSIIDALRRMYGSQIIELALKMCETQQLIQAIEQDDEYEEPTVFEKVEEKKQSIYATRMLTRYANSLETREVVLYRKTFYDDQYEKLVLMHIIIAYNQQTANDNILGEDVSEITILLNEPEQGQETRYISNLQSCLTEQEIQHELEQDGLRDLHQLKRIAKKILEERVEIRRIDDGLNEDTEGGAPTRQYIFAITFDRQQQPNASGLSEVASEQQYTSDPHGPKNEKHKTGGPSTSQLSDQEFFSDVNDAIPHPLHPLKGTLKEAKQNSTILEEEARHEEDREMMRMSQQYNANVKSFPCLDKGGDNRRKIEEF